MFEFLKKIFGEELAKQIEEKTKDTAYQVIDTKSGDWLPRTSMNSEKEKMQTQIDDLKGQIVKRDKDLEALKTSAKDSDTLTKEIDTLQTQNKEAAGKYEIALIGVQSKAAVDIALRDADAKHPDLIIAKIDMSAVKEVNGKWVGIDDQIRTLKEGDYKDQFGQTKLVGDKQNLDGKDPKPQDIADLEKSHAEAIKKGDTELAIKLNLQIFEANKKKE